MRSPILWILAILAGALIAMVGVWRRPAAAPEPDTTTWRIAAFDAQIDVHRSVDPALILYREAAPIPLPGFPTVTAIAVDTADRIHVGGGSLRALFTPEGTETGRWETAGEISALAVDAAGRVYVGLGNTVRAVSVEGTHLADFEGFAPDTIVTSMVAIGEHIFVADARRRAVLRFSPDGVRTGIIDGRTDDPEGPGFVIPSPYFDLAPGRGQTLWIVNPGLHQVEEYNLDGARIHAWSREAGLDIDRFSGCCNPCHIAQLSDGSIVTAEHGLPRVKIHTRRGAFVGVVAAPDRFESPHPGLDLAVDSRDRVLVADADRRQIRVFERRPPP